MACFHIVTAIIGAGVLGLPHALSMLGWLGGCVALVAFFLVTVWCSFMLSDMYEYDGVRHPTYGDAVVNVLGGWGGTGRLRGGGRLHACVCRRSALGSNGEPVLSVRRLGLGSVIEVLQRTSRGPNQSSPPVDPLTPLPPGRGSAFAVTSCQLLNLVLSAIGYTVAAGESLK
jgi:hypothetical protein